jgi:GNAT superfamily N-acetyltransferase
LPEQLPALALDAFRIRILLGAPMSLIEQSRADHRRALQSLAPSILPLFGYSCSAIEEFLAKDPPDAEFFEYCESERRALMQIARNDEGWNIRYVLPDSWGNRFQSVAGAIEQLKERFRKQSHRRIFILIRENPPSHSAYFAGMLPSLGFNLTPRVTFMRDIDAVPDVHPLPEGYEETAIEEMDVNVAADAYHAAHVEHSPDATADERERHRLDRREMFHREYAHDDARRSWVSIAHRGRIVAMAFGRVYGRELCIEEVGVVPEHRGRRLGRFVSIRVMQKLLEYSTGADRFFLVGTDRRYTAAMHLYPTLGFRLHEFHTYAMFEAPCHSIASERGSGGR